MDKFPEAFNRYEETVDIDEITTYSELLTSFKMWGGKKAPLSRLQRRALGIEGEKRGILPYRQEVQIYNHWKTGKQIIRSIWRDVTTGRFVSKDVAEE